MFEKKDKMFLKHKERMIAYKDTFSTDAGKKVLYDLMLRTNMINSSFDTDPLQMARKEGERNVCLMILTTVGTDIKKLEELIRETKDNE
jgi:hypothetical protein